MNYFNDSLIGISYYKNNKKQRIIIMKYMHLFIDIELDRCLIQIKLKIFSRKNICFRVAL